MSQIEQNFRHLLSKKPEIEKCYAQGLVNRRSLARYLIQNKIAKNNQFEAVIAMLRRFEFKIPKEEKDLFKQFRMGIKDDILILDFEKEKTLLIKLSELVAGTNYDQGDVLKIVVGSSTIKVFLDKKNESKVKSLTEHYKRNEKRDKISEISMIFSDESIITKGIVSAITRELAINDIVISELLTASPELLLYIKEEYVLKAYEVLKRLQR
ncbi:MAG: hypothetical protein KKF89_01100 [Nanoarchaeota archaeon]|nr:hypothetical protein [Nanoarchaeota archaeon]MBU1854295.1 hypothetical protein [Nanoarchaeota archaeon]